MPQLNRDLLREIFYEVVGEDESFKNIDNFIMGGKESFRLVLDICKKASDVVIFKDEIVAELPQLGYISIVLDNKSGYHYDEPATVLFKPLSLALATTMKSLDIRSFSPALIPMLKAINQELDEVNIQDSFSQIKDILEACINIPYVQNDVTIRFWHKYDFVVGMKFFAIPCHKLTITNAAMYLNTAMMNLDNPYLRNILHLTIKGYFDKNPKFLDDIKKFVAFLSTNFPNLETFNADISVECFDRNYCWDWNDNQMANLFKALPPNVKGSITYKIADCGYYSSVKIDPRKYDNLQKIGNSYSKIYPFTAISA